MTRAFARGTCPGLAAPMETGDGLLVRLLPTGPVRLDAFIGLCEAAVAHGNGTIEISARGSLQIRGLTPFSAPFFAAEVARLDIAIGEDVPVIADPLPGDPEVLIDADSVAAAIRRAIAEKALRLAPKVSVIVDGGGGLDLDALSADIRLRAMATQEGPKFQLALAGDAVSATLLGMVAPEAAVETVLALLDLIAERGPEARAADLLRGVTAPQLQLEAAVATMHPPRTDAIGLHRLKDGAFALGLGLAFGHAEADALAELARTAKTNGACWAQPAPDRALLLGPLAASKVMATRRAAEMLGFVAEAHDPRRRIAACPGAPSCAHGLIAARGLAAEIARQVPLPGEKGIALHISGCAKGCAHPKTAPLTVVGTARGCGLVRHGSAQATPSAYTGPANLLVELARVAGTTREAVDA